MDLYPLLKRSHAVFVIIEQMTTENIKGQTHTQIKVGKLNLVEQVVNVLDLQELLDNNWKSLKK